MTILVLKTDLKSIQVVETIAPIFDLHPQIISWSVDLEDIDNVLRIEADQHLSVHEIVPLLDQYGVQGQSLNY